MKSDKSTLEDTMIARMSVIGMLLAAALSACAKQAQSSVDEKARIHSAFGFSFLPPPGEGGAKKSTAS